MRVRLEWRQDAMGICVADKGRVPDLAVVWIRVSGELLLVKVGWRVCKAGRLSFVARSAVPRVLADTHGFRWCFLPFARFSSSSKFFRRRSPFRLHVGL